jgi:hypothetical protein
MSIDIKKMVDRFLGWKLPKDFYPDAGISFKQPSNPEWWPIGTNLLTADQAKAMFEYCLAGQEATAAQEGKKEDWLSAAVCGLEVLRGMLDRIGAVDGAVLAQKLIDDAPKRTGIPVHHIGEPQPIPTSDAMSLIKDGLQNARKVSQEVPAVEAEPKKPVSEENARFAIDAAIGFGAANTNKPPSDDHWLMPYWQMGRKLAQFEAASVQSMPIEGWKWMTHPSWNGGKPIPVQFGKYEDGTVWYRPFDTDLTEFEWELRDPAWKIVTPPASAAPVVPDRVLEFEEIEALYRLGQNSPINFARDVESAVLQRIAASQPSTLLSDSGITDGGASGLGVRKNKQ